MRTRWVLTRIRPCVLRKEAEVNRREARRERNRADFIRATQQSLEGRKLPPGSTLPGACAGKTLREYIEDAAFKATRDWHLFKVNHDRELPEDQLTLAKYRGIMRGSITALAIHIDSYRWADLTTRDAFIAKLERRVLKDVMEELNGD